MLLTAIAMLPPARRGGLLGMWWFAPLSGRRRAGGSGLFANDSSIAKSLYKAVFDRVANEHKKAIVCGDVPLEGNVVNKSAFEIVEELS